MLDRIFIVLESDKRPILVVRLQDIVPSLYIPVPPGLDQPTTSVYKYSETAAQIWDIETREGH